MSKSVPKIKLLSQKRDIVFREYVNRDFTSLREFSVLTKIGKSTISRYISSFKKEGLVVGSMYYSVKKSFFEIELLAKVGLFDFLVSELNPSVIIVFGSIRKGEYDWKSDVDIFVESYEKKVDVSHFEKVIGRKIDIFIEKSLDNLPKDLYNNVASGIKVYGSFSLK